jgi:hypothetical protein
MPNSIYNSQKELTELIRGYSNMNGTHKTDIPSLFFSQQTSEIGPSYGVNNTSLCMYSSMIGFLFRSWLVH